MRNPRSIRIRLTLWYFLSVAAILGLFGAGAWLAMKASVIEVVDHDLRVRIHDVRDFINLQLDAGPEQLMEEFREQSQLGLGGSFLQIIDPNGATLYRSARLGLVMIPKANQVNGSDEPLFSNLAFRSSTLRCASQSVFVKGRSFTIQVAEPMSEFEESLGQFRDGLLILSPIFLLLATLGGYWISSRALSPVDRITQDARSITMDNLSARLQVPQARDELQRLTLTLNEMLDRIEAAVRQIVQFTANASHELRAPLTLIHTAAEFSLRRERNSEELIDALRKILRESSRTSRLVDELLVLARADSGADQLQLRPVDIAASGLSAVERMLTLAETKRVTVSADVPAQSVLAYGDEQALARLWLILLDNAVKYTNEGGSISFAIRAVGAQVNIIVKDTGVGIASDELPHVFERFWRADKVRSRDSGGAGLGLSIAKWIVDSHRGSIEITSNFGQGTMVVVKIPMAST